MKNAQDVESSLNLNVLSAFGSIMLCLCQLSWRKTMGQMVKWRGRQQLNLWFWCVNANPLCSQGQHKLCLWKYIDMSGISAACMAVLAPAHWDVSHCAQQMGAGKFSPGTEACIHMHKKNKYIYCVCHQALAELLLEPLTGLYLDACALHPCMPLAHHMSMVALPAHGCSQTSGTKPSGSLLSPFFADSPEDQTHLFPGYGYYDFMEFKSNFLRISNHWK